MFDTHCHLNLLDDFILPKVIKTAKENGVKKFVVPGVDIKTSKKAIRISQEFTSVYAACGIHPTVEKMPDLDKLDLLIEKLIEDSGSKVVAIGEVGLDFYRYAIPSGDQIKLFATQIKIAQRLGKSIIIHNRHAAKETINTLEKSWSDILRYSLVFHCSEPDQDILSFAKSNKCFLGVDADITYDTQKQKFLKNVPLDLLVVETDTPYLLPSSLKGKSSQNLPENLNYVVEKIAEIKDVEITEVATKTTLNAMRLFKLD